MSGYKVTTETLHIAYDKLQQVLAGLEEASSKVNRAYCGIEDMSSNAINTCKADICTQGRIYDNQWVNVREIVQYLEMICITADNAEETAKKVLDEDYELTPDMIADGEWYSCKVPQKSKDSLFTAENGISFVQDVIEKELGIPGAVVSAVWKAEMDSSGLNIMKQVGKVINKTATEIIKKGTEETVKGTKPFWKAFGDELADSVADFGKKTYDHAVAKAAESVRCITEWTDAAIDGAINLVDNTVEFEGDLSKARLYEETIVETALSVGMDAMVKSASIAIVATTVGGPGIVATGVAVGAGIVINYGLDKVSEWFFCNDEGWVENVSDTLIDATHTVVNVKRDVIGKVKNILGKGITSVGKSVFTLWAT